MTHTARLLQNYLVFGLPFVLASIVWSSFVPSGHVEGDLLGTLWTVLSFNLMFWFLALLVFLLLMVALPSVREMTLSRLSFIRMRDEREEYITGHAAKTAYIASLSLLAFMLFLSVFSVKVDKLAEQVADKQHSLSIGIDFNLWAEPATTVSQAAVFGFDGLPLSGEALLLIVLLWQLAFFALTARRYK